jgi:CRP-like cAMP-binding protein
MQRVQEHQRLENRLLAALSEDHYQHLLPHLEPVSLALRQVLHEPGEPLEYVYFPTQGMVSLVSIMKEGAMVETGLIGKEGMVGLSVVLGGGSIASQAVVQVEGSALRMRSQRLKQECDRIPQLQQLLLCYMQALFTQVSQIAACNCLHNLEERFARWLLLVRDCVDSGTFMMTQEYIAQMLGVRRSGVTVAAGILQKAGIISYHRGEITILSQVELEAASCECYAMIKSEFDRLLRD